MRKFGLYFLVFFAALFSQHAGASNVKCWVPGKFEKRDFVVVKTVRGEITYWDDKTVGRPDAMSVFGLFSEELDEGAIESVKFGKRSDGGKFATIITTAEALTLNISADNKRGSLAYEDLGSGYGDNTIQLECREESEIASPLQINSEPCPKEAPCWSPNYPVCMPPRGGICSP